MCGKNATSTTTSQANPTAMANYYGDLSRASGVAGLPFQTYGGEFTAPVNAQQQTAGANINQNAGFALPYIEQASQYANAAAQPITAQQIANYQSPYTQQVVNATEAQFNQQNAQQQSQLTGNAAAQGALGGDRTGLAQAQLAGQQQLQEAPVIAGLEQSGYNTALQTALAEQQQQGQAAYSLGNLGVAGQNAALQGAGAQLGYGGLQQQTQQAQDTALYNQFLAQQAFPYQQMQWLAGIDTGVGSQMGGISQTQGPQPNPISQYGGLALASMALLNRGGGIHRDAGGRIPGFAFGGMPYEGGASYVPSINLTPGQGAPKPPGTSGQGQQQQNPIAQANQILGFSKNLGKSSLFGGADVSQNAAIQAGLDSGMDPSDFGPGVLEDFTSAGFRRGGRIAGFAYGGYADGGSPDMPIMLPDDAFPKFQDRFDASTDYGSRSSIPTYPRIPYSSGDDLSGPQDNSGPTAGFANPSVVNGQKQNLTGPIIPPGGTGGAPASAPDAGPAPVAGVGGPSLSGAPSAAPPPQAAPQPSGGDTQGKQSGFGGLFGNPMNMSPNMRQGLLAAGLGMMASRSPYVGNAIGEGGLAGISAYSGAKKEEFNESKALTQLQQHADETAKRLANETKRIEQGEERLGIERARMDQGKIPQGYEKVEGGLRALPGGPADPKAAAELAKAKQEAIGEGIDPVMLRRTAAQYNIIGGAALTNLGRGAQSGAVLQAVRAEAARQDEEAGITPEQRAQLQAEYQGQKAAQRTLGTTEARMGNAAFEAEGAIKLGRDVINKVPRTSFLPFNRLIQGFQNQTLNPDQAELFTRTQGIINAYAAVMARGANVTTDASRHRAEELLNTASNPEVYNRVLDTMQSEIDMAKNAPDRMRQFYMQRYGGNAVGGQGAPQAGGAGAPNAPTGGGGPVQVKTPAEAQALPPGTRYVTPEGKVYTR